MDWDKEKAEKMITYDTTQFQPGHSGNENTQFQSGQSGNEATQFEPGHSGNEATQFQPSTNTEMMNIITWMVSRDNSLTMVWSDMKF